MRLTLVSSFLSILLLISLLFPEATSNLVSYLPISRDGKDYVVFVAVLIIMAPICWGVLLGLIFTSPEQEVRFVQWTKRWRKGTIPFEEVEFDTSDPEYRKVAWRYYLDRRRR